MNATHQPTKNHDQPGFCEIRTRGHLSERWADWFEGLTITLEENGNTLLAGAVSDQAALYGYLKRVRDLGMPLLLVNYHVHADAPDLQP